MDNNYANKVPFSKISVGKDLAVVIPAFNESYNIENVVRQVSVKALTIVVDDGSTDDTAKIAENAGAYVIKHKTNRGYDAALETGICTAIKLGCRLAVTLDADGQHDPMLLDRFQQEFTKGADLVLGCRHRKQRWSEHLFGYIGKIIWGFDDPLCGMKGYRLEVLGLIGSFNTYRSIGTEVSIRAKNSGFKIHQIKIKTRERKGESRFGNGLIVNSRIVLSILNGLLLSARKKKFQKP